MWLNARTLAQDGWTALHISCGESSGKLFKFLAVVMGADVTQLSNAGISLLQKAAYDDNVEVIKILTIFARNAPRDKRKSYFDLKHKDAKGNTALHFACNAKAQAAVERLLALGIDSRDLQR